MMMLMRPRRTPVMRVTVRRLMTVIMRMIVTMVARMRRMFSAMTVIQREHTTAEPGDHAEHQQP